MNTNIEETADKEKEKWLKYLSITTILFALCTALATYYGGNYSSQSTSAQIEANDKWAFYQSKSIKEYLYETQVDNFQTQLLITQPGAVYDSIKKHIYSYSQSIAKYKSEKEEINKDAKHYEAERDDSSKHSSAFGLSVVFLEISILLSSIAALMKVKPIWFLSLVPGIIGLAYFINGYILFF